MLTDIKKIAADQWQQYTNRDLEILKNVSIESSKAAAEIAKNMGHVDVANAILERALSD